MKNLIISEKSIIYGFIFSTIISPLPASLGLIFNFFERIRPVLIGPFDLVLKLVPSVQTGPNSYETPIYNWILVRKNKKQILNDYFFLVTTLFLIGFLI